MQSSIEVGSVQFGEQNLAVLNEQEEEKYEESKNDNQAYVYYNNYEDQVLESEPNLNSYPTRGGRSNRPEDANNNSICAGVGEIEENKNEDDQIAEVKVVNDDSSEGQYESNIHRVSSQNTKYDSRKNHERDTVLEPNNMTMIGHSSILPNREFNKDSMTQEPTLVSKTFGS